VNVAKPILVKSSTQRSALSWEDQAGVPPGGIQAHTGSFATFAALRSAKIQRAWENW